MKGTVVSCVLDRGFFFIRRDLQSPGERDVFAHKRGLTPAVAFDETLKERRVEFDIEIAPDGRERACNITPAGD